MEAVTKNKIWLLPAGLVIGLAGIAWMISPILQYNSGYPWDNMLFVLYFIPVIGGAMIARESPRLGGILLIIYGLLGPVNGYIIYFTHPFAGGLYFLLQPIFQDALAFIIPGFLFLLSPPKRSASDIEKTVISKSYFTGLVITTAASGIRHHFPNLALLQLSIQRRRNHHGCNIRQQYPGTRFHHDMEKTVPWCGHRSRLLPVYGRLFSHAAGCKQDRDAIANEIRYSSGSPAARL